MRSRARKDFAGNDLAGFVEAHDRRAQRGHVGFGGHCFAPTAPLEIDIDQIGFVRPYGPREEVLKGASPKDHRPLVVEGLAYPREVEFELFQGRTEMLAQDFLEMRTPFVAPGELDQSHQVVASLHGRSSLRFPIDADPKAGPPAIDCGAAARNAPSRSHSSSFDQRRRPETLRTAIAIAFFWPTRTTSRLPRVMPV